MQQGTLFWKIWHIVSIKYITAVIIDTVSIIQRSIMSVKFERLFVYFNELALLAEGNVQLFLEQGL